MADESVKERFTISPIDGRGRAIAPEVLAVANDIRNNALAYGEKAVRDSAVAASLFEEAAAAVSRLLSRQTNKNTPIRDLSAYLFRSFVRRVNRVRRRNQLFAARLAQYVDAKRELNSNHRVELEILIDQIMARGDAITRDMFYRRVQGYSWNEIGRVYGISAHAAESRYSQALRRLRERLQD